MICRTSISAVVIVHLVPPSMPGSLTNSNSLVNKVLNWDLQGD